MAATETAGLPSAALALFEIGGIQPEVGPLAFNRAGEEGVHPLVDVLAQLGNLALGDARQPHGLDQIVDTPGRDACDPGLLDDGNKGLLGRLARLQERREIGAGPQLGDAQLQGAKPGVQRALAIAIAPGDALG